MIKLQDVVKTYDNGTKAIKGIDMHVQEGEFVFIVGPSGSGKSTFVKLLVGEIKPTSGKMFVGDFDVGKIKQRNIPYLRRTVGVVFQDFRLIEEKTVYENVAFVMRAVGSPLKAIKKRVPYVLDLVGILHKSRRKPGELSGGEQQRVAIARALVNNPKVLVADEPTGNLDPLRSLELMMLFEKINSLGTTVLVVTHEKELVDQFEKRVVAIDGGVIISDHQGGYYTPKNMFLTEYETGSIPGAGTAEIKEKAGDAKAKPYIPELHPEEHTGEIGSTAELRRRNHPGTGKQSPPLQQPKPKAEPAPAEKPPSQEGRFDDFNVFEEDVFDAVIKERTPGGAKDE